MKVIFPLEPKAFKKHPKSAQRLGVMMLSAMLKSRGFKVELVKATVKDLSASLNQGEPTILAYSLVSQLAETILAVNKEIKQRFSVKSFFGGPHPTYYPELILEEGVDGICLGEGDFAIVDLVSRIRDGRDYLDVSNWHFKQDDRIIKNALRPLVEDLDTLPFADRDVMKNDYLNSIMTTRGCPYQCTYCLNAAYNRLYNYRSAKIRQRSVDHVIEELGQIKARFPRTFIAFLDTILPVRKDWTEEFAKKYRKNINLPFFCNIKTDITDRETIQILKEAGCHSIAIGVESSSEEIRKKLMKRKVTNEKIIEVANWIHESGIKLHTFNIIGMPQTSFFDDVETLKFNVSIKADYAVGSVLSPYKRTEIYEIAKSLNMLSTDSTFSRGKFTFHTIDYGSSIIKRKLLNLESIYAILVKYPFLIKNINFITKLPFTKFCALIFRIWTASVYRRELLPPYWLRKIREMTAKF
ncbi:MAG: B12-binding domain-containing radical SAM protein [Thermodesulfovibrionales bacterium]|nr:B12-binding domain-containing radical SAM protein [Thermodesulfovibrionales bacterium]